MKSERSEDPANDGLEKLKESKKLEKINLWIDESNRTTPDFGLFCNPSLVT
ncbi:MAG TPA: hypothetical protein VMW01_04280 [Williamwhitmania sp.]|nr:hypothetical protein [Williamwhitmania sp.]